MLIKSITNKSLYNGITDNQIISAYIAYLSSEYQMEGYTVLNAKGYILNDLVICEIEIEKIEEEYKKDEDLFYK